MSEKTNRSSIGLREIASACNVSLMTVSRAFREKSAIRPETRASILQKAEEMGYFRYPRKGRPATPPINTANQVQLIFGNSGGSMFSFQMCLLTAVEQQLADAGFECIMRTCNGNFASFMRLLERVRLDHSQATILFGYFQPEQLEQLLLALPGALLLDNTVRSAYRDKVSTFSFDNRRAAYLGVNHLAQIGRKKILLITGPQKNFFSSDLLAGYKEALADNALEYDPERVVYADFSAGSAANALRNVLRNGISFDAIFTNDEMATGVYHILQEAKISIPEQVAVCGCDNLPIGAQLYPELSTIALDYNELTACAVNHILSGKSSSDFIDIKLPPVLCVKSSTAAR